MKYNLIIMKRVNLLFVLILACFTLPQLVNAQTVYIPDCVSSQDAVFNSTDKTVTVSGVAPTMTEYDWDTYEQYELPYITKITISRRLKGGEWPKEVYGTIDNPAKGEKFEFVDKNVDLDQIYEYSIVVYVDAQESTSVYASVYTGVVPGEVTDFAMSVADHLTSAIDFSFKAPLKSKAGADLTGTMSIEIQQYENWSFTTVHTIENVAPGQACEYKLEGLTLGKSYDFRAVAKVGTNGIGEGSRSSIFVGLDYPGTAKDFACVSKGESVELSWNHADKGGRGGCFNPEGTTYTLSRVYLDGKEEIVAEGLKGLGYTDTPGFEEERSLKYKLTAVNGAGTNIKDAVSETVVVGKASALPFTESFKNGALEHMGWARETSQNDPYYNYEAWDFVTTATMYHWPTDEYLEIEAQDSDEGLASCKFYSYSVDGQTETLVSPHIDVTGIEKAEFSFYYWAVEAEASNNVVKAYTCKNDGEWELLFTSVPEAKGAVPAWKKVVLPIELKKTAENIRVKIEAIRHDGSITNVFLDNIAVVEFDESGVEMLPVDDEVNAKVEYFNLQGMSVENPTEAGIYIKRCGKKTEKVIIR